MAKIRDDIKQQILDRSDIVDVIGEHLHLKPAGSRFRALCPFHKDSDPSFYVNPERQMFHCFGCGTGGDVIKFIQLQENLDFVGALEYLGRRIGVRVEWTGGDRAESAWDHRILEEAVDFFYQNLKRRPSADLKEVLERRGLDDETITRFQIGFATLSWDDLIEHFQRKGIEPEKLERVGLAAPNKQGGYRNWFRNRLMFPILTASGQVVGFGGRALDDSPAKYLNSPESSRFKKGRLLYALDQAKKALREQKTVLLAEGYMDVVALHRFGFTNSVGNLGTALTTEQVRLLKRYVSSCYVVYDGDAAGRKAALRSLEMFRNEDLPCRVVELPEGQDPDDYLSAHGREAMEQLIDRAREGFDFLADQMCQGKTLDQLEDRRQVVRQLGAWIGEVPSKMARAEYWSRLSNILDTPVEILQQEAGLNRKKKRRTSHEGAPEQGSDPVPVQSPPDQEQLAKETLTGLLLEKPEMGQSIKEGLETLPADEAPDAWDRALSQALEIRLKEPSMGSEQLAHQLMEQGFEQQISRVMTGDPVPKDSKKAVQQCLGVLRNQRLQRQIARQLKSLENGEASDDPGFSAEWTARAYELEKERYNLGGGK